MRNGYPLIELHRHLDGNVRLETVLDLGRRHGIDLPAWTAEELRPHIQITERVPSLMAFIAKFGVLRRVMVDDAAVRRIVRENLEDAAREGIDYIELRFSPYFMAEEHGLDVDGVVEAACDALEEARGSIPVRARLIGIVARNYGPEIGWRETAAAIRCRDRGIVALDLAGDEANYPGELFVDHFRKAREAGLRTIAHAGEAAGAESVRQAVLGLGAERIGHGIRCLEDPAVADLLAERRIPLEVCPTSNLHTSTVASYRTHPLPTLLARGLAVTLNTDDPSISGIDLAHEYRIAVDEIGLTETDLRRMQETALAAAFLTNEERSALLSTVKELFMAKSTIDLSKLSLDELQTLAREIETEIVTRRETERERVLQQMRELAASIGTTPEELLGPGDKARAGKIQPKYRHPDDPALTWTGRGKRPAWLTDELAAGKTLDDFAIA